jgi:hypothetical protein
VPSQPGAGVARASERPSLNNPFYAASRARVEIIAKELPPLLRLRQRSGWVGTASEPGWSKNHFSILLPRAYEDLFESRRFCEASWDILRGWTNEPRKKLAQNNCLIVPANFSGRSLIYRAAHWPISNFSSSWFWITPLPPGCRYQAGPSGASCWCFDNA